MSIERDQDFERLEDIAAMMTENPGIEFENGKYVYYGLDPRTAFAVVYISGAWSAWQAKANTVPEGFVLIKDDTKTVVAIERMVEQQVEASGMDSRRLERLDGWKIIEAAVKAQEPK